MKDTIIALLVVTGIAASYYYLKSGGYLQNSLATSASRVSPKLAQKQKSKTHKGVTHAQPSYSNDDQQAQNLEQTEGAEGFVAEAESLPSIYKDEGFAKQPVTAEDRNTRKGRGKKFTKKKSIHGVPVQAFIDSRQNAIANYDIPEQSDLGVRVFVQCHELKKRGPEYVGQKGCESLLTRRSDERRLTLY